ncbi:NifB/NifX family molybdenum-iron cluster-binding protein [Sharpea azabuensis]|uniref:Predicted Fe-Mo cluster-binding protein, NifX family n=1 Tax=Sharpea azabuensis TaxID=322505 RepID=A0A1H6SMJ5_9FIRM|nr:NifB/NifX family molybdenum-iron cluster-binding protein [Sharpea azabuensis]HAV17853.1 dinitrogenase iron-molybdenum cofactor biosynthesis protein [Erysipelotrichaceae bacterium]MDD6511792.1 NifB/NifX family molybdenum-iron cluster-binding protein [Sharpea azabuensis]MEE3308841.1 NifB/NifX family molybdenum-iron cluster-binding protein [Sharpea azabuensis]SEI64762.1 Predicted Fe-Mo cluster-binding protein, NifX family [Sharpea azabuensis]SFD52506.1 Predicted Fe-Mo cluster-binding protein, 
MKIAVPFENENVYSDFGSAKQFKVYNIEDQSIKSTQILDTKGIKFGALAVLLNEHDVKLVLLDEVSKGSASALKTNGIQYEEHVTGNCDSCVKEYLSREE